MISYSDHQKAITELNDRAAKAEYDAEYHRARTAEALKRATEAENKLGIVGAISDTNGRNYQIMLERALAAESKLDRYRWIPVDERLPPDEMSVLAFKSNGHVDKTCRYAGGWLLPSLEPHVTHWMPLPEPPK